MNQIWIKLNQNESKFKVLNQNRMVSKMNQNESKLNHNESKFKVLNQNRLESKLNQNWIKMNQKWIKMNQNLKFWIKTKFKVLNQNENIETWNGHRLWFSFEALKSYYPENAKRVFSTFSITLPPFSPVLRVTTNLICLHKWKILFQL